MTIGGAIAELQNLIDADDVPFYYKDGIKKVIETIQMEFNEQNRRLNEIAYSAKRIKADHYYTADTLKECPWCKAVCASTDKYCHECGWHIADTPQEERSE